MIHHCCIYELLEILSTVGTVCWTKTANNRKNYQQNNQCIGASQQMLIIRRHQGGPGFVWSSFYVCFLLNFNCIIVFVYYVYLYLCITYFCVFLCICNCICIFVFVFIFVYLFICICICFCVSFEEVERRDALCICRPIGGQKAGEQLWNLFQRCLCRGDIFCRDPVISFVEAPWGCNHRLLHPSHSQSCIPDPASPPKSPRPPRQRPPSYRGISEHRAPEGWRAEAWLASRSDSVQPEAKDWSRQ